MKKTLSSFLLLFLFFGIGWNVFAQENKCEYEIVSEKYPLGETYSPDNITISTSFREQDYIFSPDSKKLTYIARRDGKEFVIKNWKKVWGWYYDIYEFSLKYSSNWKNLAFLAMKEKRDENTYVYTLFENWVENKKYKSIDPDSLVYSPDWKKLSFITLKNWKYIIVNDWEESKWYDRIWNWKYSEDGTIFSFAAMRNKKMLFVSNGKESKEYHNIDRLAFSKDGKHFIFRAINYGESGKFEDREYYAVEDLKEGKEYNKVSYLSFLWDTNESIFAAFSESGSILVKGGEDYLSASYPSVAHTENLNSFAFAWWDRRWEWNKEWVVKDWEKLKEYDWVDTLTYSKDWKRFLYKAKENQKHIGRDWKEWKRHEGKILDIIFSPKGNLIYIVKEDDGEFVVINWKEWKKYGLIGDRPEFSPNWENMFYLKFNKLFSPNLNLFL